jgi:hypothetical protein
MITLRRIEKTTWETLTIKNSVIASGDSHCFVRQRERMWMLPQKTSWTDCSCARRPNYVSWDDGENAKKAEWLAELFLPFAVEGEENLLVCDLDSRDRSEVGWCHWDNDFQCCPFFVLVRFFSNFPQSMITVCSCSILHTFIAHTSAQLGWSDLCSIKRTCLFCVPPLGSNSNKYG